MRPLRLHRGRTVLALIALAAGLVMPGAEASAGSVDVRYVDDDGHAGPGCSAPRVAFRNIQAAVKASGPGDTIKVCPGTYRGHVRIGSGKKGLRIVAATGTRPVLRPYRTPPTYTGVDNEGFEFRANRGIIHLTDAAGILIRGLRFAPHGGSGDCTDPTGVTIAGVSSARIVDNVFAGTGPLDTGCRRFETVVSIVRDFVRGYDPAEPQVVVRANRMRDFRLGVTSALGFVRVRDNHMRMTRSHRDYAHAVIAGGIRLEVLDNVLRVADDGPEHANFVGTDDSEAPTSSLIAGNVVDGVTRGIASSWGPIMEIRDNVLVGRRSSDPDRDGDDGIYLGTRRVRVIGNVVTGFAAHGIFANVVDGVISGNDFRGNGGTDCHQDGTDGVRWRNNLGYESSPRGLCSRY